MTEPNTFMPDDTDPLAGVAANPASAAPDAQAVGGWSAQGAGFGAPAGGSPGYVFDPAANAVDRPSVFEQVQGRGISNDRNNYGTYAIFLGAVSFGASLMLYFMGAGLGWINVIIGLVATYYGVKGFNASRNRLATNGGLALTGGILGLVGALASIAYYVIVAFIVAAMVGGFEAA